MRIVNVLGPKSPMEPEVAQVPQSDISPVVPDDSNLQQMRPSPTSEASQRRAYKKHVLEEASKRRSEMTDLLFVHLHRKIVCQRPNYGGVTVAFKRPVVGQQRDCIEIATCICPRHLQLDKKFGANFAALNFLNKRTINVPIRRIGGEDLETSIVRTLTEMFT